MGLRPNEKIPEAGGDTGDYPVVLLLYFPDLRVCDCRHGICTARLTSLIHPEDSQVDPQHTPVIAAAASFRI